MIRATTLLIVTLCLDACGGSDSASATSDRAVAFQSDASHTGVSGILAPVFPQAAAWSRIFSGRLSYPLIADGRVFVIESADVANGFVPKLHALNRLSGVSAWVPVELPSQRVGGGLAFENGRVFVTTFEGEVLSIDAATGKLDWRMKLPDSFIFVSAPTASGGFVYVGDGGGHRVVAIDEAHGTVAWTATVQANTLGTPSVAADSVFVAADCRYYGLVASTGAERWHHDGVGCSGGVGATLPVVQGRAYGRDFMPTAPIGPNIDVLDPTTGATLNRYTPASPAEQGPIAAVTSTAVFLLDGGSLRRFDPLLSATRWSFAGDGTLSTPPLVVGAVVLVGGSSGTIYAVDGDTGSASWSARLPAGFDSPNDFGSVAPTGLAAGEGYLIVPAGATLTAFRLTP